MLELPDGGVTSVEVEDTDVLAAEPVVAAASDAMTLSCEGARRLLGLLKACGERAAGDAVAGWPATRELATARARRAGAR